MKTFWNLISVIAVVNFLAIVGAGLWLFGTGRIDRDRFMAIKDLLGPPQRAEAAKAPEPTNADESRDTTPTEVRISAQDRADRQIALNLRRLHDEREQLARGLSEGERDLVAREKVFDAERKAWEAATAQSKENATEEQFRKAVKMLESVPPKQGKEWILTLCGEGHVDQAVAYLDAMSPYKASGVMKTFKGDDEKKVATDLLERLRQRTPESRAAQSQSAPTAPDAAIPARTTAAESKPSGPIANAGAEVGSPGQPRSR